MNMQYCKRCGLVYCNKPLAVMCDSCHGDLAPIKDEPVTPPADKYNGLPTVVYAVVFAVSSDYTVHASDFEQGRYLSNGDIIMPATIQNMFKVSDLNKGMEVKPSYYPLGTWKCLCSPWGWCLYDHKADPAHDQCVYCGDPEERK